MARLIEGQVDSTEFAELAESAESYNCFPSSIKQLKNFTSTYSDTFSRILSVKNHTNFIFHQFHVFIYDPIPKNENVELVETFRKFHLLCAVMDSGYSGQLDHLIIFFIYNTNSFSKILFSFELIFKQKIGNRTFICPSENRSQPNLETNPVYLSKF